MHGLKILGTVLVFECCFVTILGYACSSYTVCNSLCYRSLVRQPLQLSMQGLYLTLLTSQMSVYMGSKIIMASTLESSELFVCGMLHLQEKLRWRSNLKKVIPSLVLPLVEQRRYSDQFLVLKFYFLHNWKLWSGPDRAIGLQFYIGIRLLICVSASIL